MPRSTVLRQRFTTALRKKARRGFSGYPIATMAFYGPDDKLATKVAVGIILAQGHEPAALERWFSEAVDVRNNHDISEEMVRFLRHHDVKSVVSPDRIMGCPTKRASTTRKTAFVRNARSGPTATVGLARSSRELHGHQDLI